MSEGHLFRAQKGCASVVGFIGLLFLGGSVAGIIQGAEWPLILLNLGISALIVLAFLGLLRFFKWGRQRNDDARLEFFENGFIQTRPSGFRSFRPQACLWNEIHEVTRGNVVGDEVLWLKVVKANGDVIRIPNQWLGFPEIAQIIDSRGIVLETSASIKDSRTRE
ncbi:MAG: hypothetical protein LC113_08380 [Acidobacteria bacterium]|nr:hypothetical protein [Acidobacteriota bacterium]